MLHLNLKTLIIKTHLEYLSLGLKFRSYHVFRRQDNKYLNDDRDTFANRFLSEKLHDMVLNRFQAEQYRSSILGLCRGGIATAVPASPYKRPF